MYMCIYTCIYIYNIPIYNYIVHVFIKINSIDPNHGLH